MNHIWIEKNLPGSHYCAAVRNDIGGRSSQQDYAYLNIDRSDIFAVVCDGMGGESCGEIAAEIAVGSMREAYFEYRVQGDHDIPAFLFRAMAAADRAVFEKLNGRSGGTTMVAAFLCNGSLYWVSVGDSRLYIMRSGELLQVTRDHNYRLRISERLARGEITPERYRNEDPRGDALISFLGIGGVQLYDLTQTAFPLQPGDLLLLTTDGLCKSLPQERLRGLLIPGIPLSEKSDALLRASIGAMNRHKQDNTTFIIIEAH